MIELILDDIDENEWEFADDLVDLSAHEELDQAIDLWHQGKHSSAELILKGIISKNPYHIDAYHHLSLIMEELELDFEAYLCCREAVRIGLSVIPDGFSWNSSKLPWLNLDNRPFLRAYHNMGLWLEKRHELEEAILLFKDMLSVCPGDNLGVRYLLPKLFLEKGDLLAVIRFCKEHHDDYSPEIMYTHPLALVLSGDVDKATPLLAEAISSFPLVIKELIKKRHARPKNSSPGSITFGGADQAFEYWVQYGKFWSSSKKAMELIETF